MSEDRTAYLGYGKKAMNEVKKPQRHVVKETPTEFTLKVPAFTHEDRVVDGKTKSIEVFIGWATTTLFKVNKEGLEALKAALTLEKVKDLNRQEITDVRNNLAREYKLKALEAKVMAGTATPTEVSKVFAAKAKSNPELAKQAALLLKKVM